MMLGEGISFFSQNFHAFPFRGKWAFSFQSLLILCIRELTKQTFFPSKAWHGLPASKHAFCFENPKTSYYLEQDKTSLSPSPYCALPVLKSMGRRKNNSSHPPWACLGRKEERRKEGENYCFGWGLASLPVPSLPSTIILAGKRRQAGGWHGSGGRGVPITPSCCHALCSIPKNWHRRRNSAHTLPLPPRNLPRKMFDMCACTSNT